MVSQVNVPALRASLARLAYHFDYDHADGRDTDSYSTPMRAMVRHWRAHYCPGGLTMLSSAQALTISDRRPGADEPQTVLSGVERAVYEHCDEAHHVDAIERHLISLGHPLAEAALRQLLERWTARRLMLRDEDWFLSLAVRTDDWWKAAGDDALKEALTAVLVELAATRRGNVIPSPHQSGINEAP